MIYIYSIISTSKCIFSSVLHYISVYFLGSLFVFDITNIAVY